jgi:hypothetical protein
MCKKYLRIELILIGLLLAGVGFACSRSMSAGALPVAALATPTFSLVPAATMLPTVAPQPSIQETRRLVLEWPPVIRAGDADTVCLTLEVDENGNLTPTAEIKGHVTRGQTVTIPNLCDTYNVVAEARLDMAGMQVVPSETASQPLSPGQSVTFYWSVRSAEAGKFRGVV